MTRAVPLEEPCARQLACTVLQTSGGSDPFAEFNRALRHLAVQRKILGAFFEEAARRYLVLLGIAQTCRFQGKSLLRFLMSEEKDIDLSGLTLHGLESPIGSSLYRALAPICGSQA